jgi:ribonuclease P protein component
MGNFSLLKHEKLLNRADFVKLNRSGQRHQTTHFTVILKQNGLNITRLGVTVRKNVGNAVKRNRTKRLIREIFRLNKSEFPQGYDIVTIAKKDVSYLDLWSIKEELGEIVFNKTFRA